MIISGCDRGTRGSSGVSVTRSNAVDDDKRGDKRKMTMMIGEVISDVIE
jgi:hypothetical protein